MAMTMVVGRKRGLFARLLAAATMVCVYAVGTLATSGVVMTLSVGKAEARRGRRGGRGRRGRGGVGIGTGIFLFGVSYCAVQRSECGELYPWNSRRWYRCVRSRGC